MIGVSDRMKAIELINEAVQSGARLEKACEVLGIHDRTYKRWVGQLKETNSVEDGRPNAIRPEPANKLSEAECQKILEVSNSEEFASVPPNEIVPALADRGEYIASESTFYRVLRKHNMQHHRGNSSKPVKRPITTHKATAPCQIWTWDITDLCGAIKGVFYYLYLISDLFSRKIVGWEVWAEESAEHASDLIKNAVLSEKRISTSPLVLHSDNGSPMKGATMLATLYSLGITPSNSRPRVSNDNSYAESLFKTLKFRPDFKPNGFESIDDARLWCYKFVEWYNNNHHHSGLNYLTPNQRHSGFAAKVFEDRTAVYELAKEKHPERWNGRETRNWSLSDEVLLNPEKQYTEEELEVVEEDDLINVA
jgi:putative transposase